MIVVRSEVDRRKEYIKQMDLKLPLGSKHPLVDLVHGCLQDDPTKRPSTQDVLGRLRHMVDEVGRIPDDRDSLGRMEVIKLLHQQDSLHTMKPREKEEVRREGGGRGGRDLLLSLSVRSIIQGFILLREKTRTFG